MMSLGDLPVKGSLPVTSSDIPRFLLPLPKSTFFPFPPFSLSFCLPYLDCYSNECLSDAVKLKVEQKLEQIGKLQGVWLHTAHVLCMDAILSVGLEMGSHNPDCWPHVFRCVTGSPVPQAWHCLPVGGGGPGGGLPWGRGRTPHLPARKQFTVIHRVWKSPK